MAKNRRLDDAKLEGVRLLFRNFAGKAQKFSPEGVRSFSVRLNPETAEAMRADGWNIKQLEAREEGDIPQDYIQVKVNFGGPRPPRLVLINSRGRQTLEERDAKIFDYVDYDNVDLILSPYQWEYNGKTGITAYLSSIYVTIKEDDLELKYADVPDAPGAYEPVRDTNDWGPSSSENRPAFYPTDGGTPY